MHKMTTKRQVTVPQEVCQALNLAPGDFVEIFQRDGVAHIVKMKPGSLAGTMPVPHRSLEDDDFRALAKSRAAKKFAGEDE